MRLEGVLNFYKPPGWSSAQAVAFVKRLTRAKTGHAGTLDPEAAGVLPMLLGRATRLCDDMMAQPKQYLAEIAFGASTDTQDAQGMVLERGTNYPTLAALKEAVPAFLGEGTQLPPQYSALKIGGKTAYQLAREGIAADIKPRPVRFDSITVLRAAEPHGFMLRVRCGKGAYIRTLCHDLGEALGCPAHLRFLLREEAGGLNLEKACSPQAFADWVAGGCKTDFGSFSDMGSALRGLLPALSVPEALRKPAVNGVALPVVDIPGGLEIRDGNRVCLYLGDELLGIYTKAEDAFRVTALLYAAGEE